MPNFIQSQQKVEFGEDILSQSLLYPFDIDLVPDKLDVDDDWSVNNLTTNALELTEQLFPANEIEASNASTWDAINAWLFSSEDESLKEIKDAPSSSCHTSSSSVSSETEYDNGPGIMSQEPIQPVGYDSHTNQVLSSFHVPQPDVASANILVDDGSNTVDMLNNAIHQISASLSEPQLKVYKKFIPIKPKLESPDIDCNEAMVLNRDITTTSKYASAIPSNSIKVENFERSKPQSKRRADQVNDVEQLKSRKQKRMARNRESALQSRQRKKELMQTLELRLNALTSVNSQLKLENDCLKDKIKHLETENSELKNKKVDVPDLAKKTSCVLVLFVFLAINMKPLSEMSSSSVDSTPSYQTPMRHGRYLLEHSKAPQPNDFPSNIIYDREAAKRHSSEGFMDILDRKVIRKIKRLYRLQDKIKRKQIAAEGQEELKRKANETSNDDQDCSVHFNKTEAFRLNEALEKLVKVPKKKTKITKNKKGSGKQTKLHGLRNILQNSGVNCTDVNGHIANCSRNTTNRNDLSRKQSRSEGSGNVPSKTNEVQIFQYDWGAFERFQKSINRQPNTFYFVSFRRDHILLPPLELNETQRPRVSFILPSSNTTNPIWNSTDDKVSLMQIDCQVMDTKLFQISKQNIPKFNLPLSSFFLRQT